MKYRPTPRRLNRRDFLKLGTQGALLAALGGGAITALLKSNPSQAAPAPPNPQINRTQPSERPNAVTRIERLVATDGFISLPGRRESGPGATHGLYVFGFNHGDLNGTVDDLTLANKGLVKHPAPIIAVNEFDEVNITVTNVGLVVRPDLDDSHTMHWHGFRNPNAIFDGVPEVSIAVPVSRDFNYFFKPRGAGTYMYHCHFEDSEHVQMGMDGIVFVRPDTGGVLDPLHHAYNDTNTAFHREYTLLLNEIDTTPHDNLENVQEFVWSNYKPNYWVINGRSYPDTILSDTAVIGTDLEDRQPVSSLIQAEPGEKILLRFASLGYQQQAMQLLGIPMTVIGHDASFLGPLVYSTSTIYIGPGEARDVLFTAPAFNGSLPNTDSDDAGNYNYYWLKNANYQRLVNGAHDDDDYGVGGTPQDVNGNNVALGGQITQVRVYESGSLGTQTSPNQTFPAV